LIALSSACSRNSVSTEFATFNKDLLETEIP